MTIGTPRERRRLLANWIADQRFPCHVTAMLRQGHFRPDLEDRIREWFIRVNRNHLGRNWYRKQNRGRQMWGIVHFETGDGGWHAHMELHPPKAFDLLDFAATAPFIFTGYPQSGSASGGAGVAPGGKMMIQIIGPTAADHLKVARYDTKEMLYRHDPESDFKFIDQLTALRRPRLR